MSQLTVYCQVVFDVENRFPTLSTNQNEPDVPKGKFEFDDVLPSASAALCLPPRFTLVLRYLPT